MRILVDGYNLIRRVPELRRLDSLDLQEGREALLAPLAAYRTGKGHRITVVFDAAEALHLGGGREKVMGVTVLYSPRGRDADRVIIEALRDHEADVLVSADRELMRAAAGSDVTVVTPELFWDRVQEELYRRFKGEEDEEEETGRRAKTPRKLSKARRRDLRRRESL